jgi:pseudolysin
MIWGEQGHGPDLFQKKGKHNKFSVVSPQQDYQLQQLPSDNNDHIRYQIMYKGIPVWGHQLISHTRSGSKPLMTGIQVSGIENDVTSIEGKLSAEMAQQKVMSAYQNPKLQQAEKVIYLDQNNKAHLAYHIAFFAASTQKPIQSINAIIDANTGAILKQWDAARSQKIGQGPGGNSFPLPYRPGMFQHGDALPGLPSLGKVDVQLRDGQCFVENDNIKVFNLANVPLGFDAFPITTFAEKKLKLPVFSFPCEEGGLNLNYSDGATGPVNYAFSPVNDTMYFATETLEMYQKVYGVPKPIGDDLPLKAYTHLGLMDNAFAVPTIKLGRLTMAHQQIVIGNGSDILTAPAQTVLAHELSHLFTAVNSNLIYDNQPGAINEAFSDMAAIALLDYLRKDYSWYWDGEDWSIGREAMIGGLQPIRYMDDPTKDGISIAHMDSYVDSLNVHQTSGVFNKAFYNLAHKPNYSVQRAFQLMVDANRNYWSPIAYFDFAACGVIQAAHDRHWDKQAVIDSFAEVGVKCPVPPLDRM